MTVEMLSILAGSLLALLFAYLPGLSGWYQRLEDQPLVLKPLVLKPLVLKPLVLKPLVLKPLDRSAGGGTRKRLVMLACLAVTAATSFGLACSGWGTYFGLSLSCSQGGAAELLRAFILALIANQSTHRISPRLARPDVLPPRQ
jgi:hypothetical protein